MQCDSFCRGCVALESVPQPRGLTGLRPSFPPWELHVATPGPCTDLEATSNEFRKELPATAHSELYGHCCQSPAFQFGCQFCWCLGRIRRITSFSTAPQSSLIPAIAGGCWSLADSIAIHLGSEGGLGHRLKQPLPFPGGSSPNQRSSRLPFSQDSRVPKWGVLDDPKTSACQLACNLPFVRVAGDAWLLFC